MRQSLLLLPLLLWHHVDAFSTRITSAGKTTKASQFPETAIHGACSGLRFPALVLTHTKFARRMETKPYATGQSRSSSALAAFPTSDVVMVLGHVIGGALGTPFVVGATNLKFGWYRRIRLPPWTPPDRAFAPIWTSLYALMGIAAGQIYKVFKQSTLGLSSGNTAALALAAWCIHCIGILSWAPVFFGLKRLRLGAAINVGLWISLPLTILPLYYQVRPSAALLLLPYFAWLTFANALNLAICRLNPTKNGTNEAVLQAQIATLQKEASRYADG